MMLNDSKLYRSCLILLCCVAFSWSFIEAKMWGNGRPEMSKKKDYIPNSYNAGSRMPFVNKLVCCFLC